MLRITIISVGKLKEDYWKEAEKEYLKRLSYFTKLEIKELKEEKFDDKTNVEMIKEKEAEKIIGAISKDSYVIVLDKEGKQFSSENMTEEIKTMEQSNNVTIIIGGPLGLHDSILKIAKKSWSFSKMTFPHQMIRVFLLEQLYRGFMIKENRSYHY
ncbi:23S rRNA (pseudouridine(1915)-N(3))-methyltransferase RlmH [Candidatus Parcubacteria bacterium]|jgi:23S rRNA (pseudouridine1915-N3)-methyltransferase|nr:23S rRNA (pseudouridine(1915)-N(3))-methyltransferase RlmH [Candidatus Parcubacteria bacterium]MBT3949143.1 23S rRNA (pseudouridine(1915)-N(3))-methyltransferase RlmH [Candidatus Parcubacteria bacterium]